jgi:DNA-directed RNA polymerase subunit RPC12/RpoP
MNTSEITADIDIDCPRCGSAVTERFYGPCAECRRTMRSELKTEQSAMETVEYEPKMNVTPNAVATKD